MTVRRWESVSRQIGSPAKRKDCRLVERGRSFCSREREEGLGWFLEEQRS
jgi:hypothetical protein